GGHRPAAEARDDPLLPGLERPARRAREAGPRTRGGDPERGREGRDPRRPGSEACDRRGDGDRRQARRRRREGAPRPHRSRRHAALLHGLDRPAGHEAELDADERVRHLPDDRLVLPLLRVPAAAGEGARRPDRPRRAHAQHPLPDGAGVDRRREGDARGADAASPPQDGPSMARAARGRGLRVVALDRGAGAAGRGPDQPAASLLGAQQAPARRCDPLVGLRVGGQLVRTRPEAEAVAPGVALGDARDDGAGRAVRDRGQVRVPEPSRRRTGGRRGDADERDGRADHRGQVLRALVRSSSRRARAQQPRPEPGDVGAARDGGRPEEPDDAEDPRRPLRRVRADDRARRRPDRDAGRDRRGVGRSVLRRPAVRDRRRHRPRGAAAPAAHHGRAGEALHQRSSRRRSRLPRDDHRVLQAEGARVPAGQMKLDVSCFTIPTDEPESDGTLEWDSTTVVVVEAVHGGRRGIGWTYAPEAAGKVVVDLLAPVVEKYEPEAVAALWLELGAQLRNAGRPGIAHCALSAVDLAVWDVRARLLDVPLTSLLPAAHDRVPVYGSGGFCSYSDERLRDQRGGFVAEGIPRVKMKLGRDPERDTHRLDVVRDAIGDAELYVDANGAFTAKEAVRWAHRYVDGWDVRWFEEPVSSAEFDGLRLVREHSTLDVAAGEYAYVLADFRN